MTKGHYYRGYLVEKPYGCDYWNIREIDENGVPDWCFAEGYAETLKKARETIDYLIEEKKPKYPGVDEAEKEKDRAKSKAKFELAKDDDEPDFINGAPNYDKFKGWDTEKVLVWLNID